jgi:hypothetical protein
VHGTIPDNRDGHAKDRRLDFMQQSVTNLKRWSRSLQAKLLILPVLLVLVFIWGGNWVAGKYLFERQKEFLQAQQSSAATVYAEGISAKVQERIHTLAALAKHIDSQRLHDEKYVRQFLAERYVLPVQFAAGTLLLDRNGTVLADLPRLKGRQGSNLRRPPVFPAGTSHRTGGGELAHQGPLSAADAGRLCRSPAGPARPVCRRAGGRHRHQLR